MKQKELDTWLKATEQIALKHTCEYQLSQSIVDIQNSSGHFAMSVTKSTCARAMKFLRMLINRFEKEGWDLSVEGTRRSEPASAVIVDGERVPFKIREKHSRVTDRSGAWPTSTLQANGILAVEFYYYYGVKPAKEYRDTDYTKLEDKLEDIVVWLRHAGNHVREQRLEQERFHEEMAERERQRKEQEEVRAQRISEAQSVIKDFRRYRKACELREFANILQSRVCTDEMHKRIQTTLQIADWIDPFTDYCDDILAGHIDVDKLLSLL